MVDSLFIGTDFRQRILFLKRLGLAHLTVSSASYPFEKCSVCWRDDRIEQQSKQRRSSAWWGCLHIMVKLESWHWCVRSGVAISRKSYNNPKAFDNVRMLKR